MENEAERNRRARSTRREHSAVLVSATSSGPLYVRGRGARYRPATAEQIVEGARSLVEDRACRGVSFKDPAAARTYFRDRLCGLEREVFATVLLDTRHRLVESVELFHGTIDGAEVHPREVVRRALLCNAAAVIVSHNHPSGDPEPSVADRAVTARLKHALALLDVRLLGHVIVGGRQTVSLAERGWL